MRRLDADGDWNLSSAETALRGGDAGAAGGGEAEGGRAGSPDMTGFQGSMTEANRGPFGATLFNDGVGPGRDNRAFDGYIFYMEHNTNMSRTVGNTTWLLNSSFQPCPRRRWSLPAGKRNGSASLLKRRLAGHGRFLCSLLYLT